MNKDLIKKFRFEAAEHANSIKPLGITKWNEIRDEKFAELIIRECAKALQTEMYRLDTIPGREVSAQTMETAAELIKKRFGVK